MNLRGKTKKGLLILTCLVLAGLFFVFTCAIAPGFRHLDDATYAQAFRAINRAILNGWFLLVFFTARSQPSRTPCSATGGRWSRLRPGRGQVPCAPRSRSHHGGRERAAEHTTRSRCSRNRVGRPRRTGAVRDSLEPVESGPHDHRRRRAREPRNRGGLGLTLTATRMRSPPLRLSVRQPAHSFRCMRGARLGRTMRPRRRRSWPRSARRPHTSPRVPAHRR